MSSAVSAVDGFNSFFGEPIFIGLVASLLSGAGLSLLSKHTEKVRGHEGVGLSTLKRRFSLQKGKTEKILICGLSSFAVSIVVLLWTQSAIITTPFSLFAVVISWVYLKNKDRKAVAAMEQVWPEVTDHLISAVHSGLSLSEALVGLGTRGPEVVRPYFILFNQEFRASGNFVSAAEKLKSRLNSHGSDQILEAILLAKSLGGSELLQIFRTLGDFLRQDLALRKEIEIKHGWIKNSAHLSSAAPWLLLLILSSQPGTAEAFAAPAGVFILFVGLFLTTLGYLWMGRLGQLPKLPRVFE